MRTESRGHWPDHNSVIVESRKSDTGLNNTPKLMLECPKCNYEGIVRLPRRRYVHKMISELFGYYPWQCSKCDTKHFQRHRGR